MKSKHKEKINVLMNIDNYFGEHQGRMAPMIIFLLLSATPFILYIFLLAQIVPLKWALIFEVFFTLFVARKVLFREDEKLRAYLKERENEFTTANDLIRVSHVHSDGLIEYQNGVVAYIISAFTTTYFEDSKLSADLEDFFGKLRNYEFDICCHQVVNEHNLQDNLENMRVYADQEMLQERIEFYMQQDDYCNSFTKLYRINIIVKASKYDWKKLKSDLMALLRSDYAKVFHTCYICDQQQCSDVMSRDLCNYIDLAAMLQNKYSNDKYYGSQVLFYGEDVPNEYRKKEDGVGLRKRRVVEK